MADEEEEVNQDALQRLIDMCMKFERELGRDVPGEHDNSCSDGDSDKLFDGVSMKDMLSKLSVILSGDATKLSLALKPPLAPEGAVSLITKLGDTIFRIVGFADSIPPSAGQTMRRMVVNVAKDVCRAAITLAASFQSDEVKAHASHWPQGYLVSTGQLWEVSKQLQTNIPADNQEAVQMEWRSKTSQLEDALTEAEEFIQGQQNEDGDAEKGDDGWDDILGADTSVRLEPNELVACQKAVQVVKLTKMLLKKISVRCIQSSNPKDAVIAVWLDDLLVAGAKVVDDVDEVAAGIYEPESLGTVVDAFISQSIIPLRDIAQKFADEDVKKWLEMCMSQYETLQSKISAEMDAA